MDLLRQQGKIRKYKFLSRFPGRIGRIYQEKLANRVLHFETYKAFDEALRHCSQMICIDIGANVGTITSIRDLRLIGTVTRHKGCFFFSKFPC